MADFTVTLDELVAPTAKRTFVDANTNLVIQQSFSRTLTETVGISETRDTSPPIPTFPDIEWPPGTTLFELNWRLLSQAVDGAGVSERSHLRLTESGTDMGVTVNAGTVFYEGTEYQLGSDTTVVLPDGDGTYDRWDTIYYDLTEEEVQFRVGNPSTTPTPPDLKGEELFLGIVKVVAGATNVQDADIHNWRTTSRTADSLPIDDAGNHYTSTTVEGALQEAVDKFLDAAGDALEGPLELSSFTGSAPLDLGTNPGQFGEMFDATIDGNSAQGTEHSFTLSIDSTPFLKMYAESDGSGSIQNIRIEVRQETRFENVVDFNYQVVKNFVAENVSTDPGTGNPGRFVYNTTVQDLKVDRGDAFEFPRARFDPDIIVTDESGTVKNGEAGIMHIRGLGAGETMYLRHAALVLADGTPAPDNLDMVLARFDNSGNTTRIGNIIEGDGTVKDDESGDPLFSYENTTGSKETIGILIDNGKFPNDPATGSDQDIQATATGRIVTPLSVTIDETVGASDAISTTKS